MTGTNTQQMVNLWRLRADMEGNDGALQIGIRMGHPMVLSHVFRPGFDEEPFDDALRVCSVLGHAPQVGTVAAAPFGEAFQRLQKCVATFRCHPVLDLHHHRPAIALDWKRQQRLRPVIRRFQIGFTLRQP